jgi:hypothetical protein
MSSSQTIRTSTGPRWGSSSFSSSTASLKVGRTSTTYYRGRIGFPSVGAAVSGLGDVTSIKLYMNRTDEYSSKVLEIGICTSADWSPAFDQAKDISISTGTGSKNWDLTSWASTILGYDSTWYLHVRHGSGTNSYCEFQGGTTGSCPRLVVGLNDSTVTIDLTGSEEAFTVGSTKGITVTGNIPNGSYSLDYSMGNETDSIHSGMSSGQTYNWLLPNSLIEQFDTSVTDTITIIATGYDASNTQLVQNTFDFPISLPADYAPVISNPTLIPENAYGDNELLVQNVSTLRFDVDAETKYNAEIARYDVALCNKTYTAAEIGDIETDILSEAGTFTAVVSVTDSRGSTASTEVPVSVMAYNQPGIASVSLFRADSEGEALETGTYLGYRITGQVSRIGQAAPCTLTIQWKPSDEVEYDDQKTTELSVEEDTSIAAPDPNLFYFVAAGTLDISLDANALDVRTTVEDGMNFSVQKDDTLPCRSVALDILASGNGLALGKTAELEGTVDFGYDARFRNEVSFDKIPTLTASDVDVGYDVHFLNDVSFVKAPTVSASEMDINFKAKFHGDASFDKAPTFANPAATRSNLGVTLANLGATLTNLGVRVGTFSISRSTWTADTNYTCAVTFSTALPAAPTAVLVGFLRTAQSLTPYSIGTTSYTTTGFTFNIARNAARSTATDFTFVYIAI